MSQLLIIRPLCGRCTACVSPNSRLIDRRAVATATKVGDTAYIFIVSAAAVKWKDEQERVTAAARTFTAS